MMKLSFAKLKNRFGLLYLSIFLLMASEWLFYTTQPSFLANIPFLHGVAVLLLAATLVFIVLSAWLFLVGVALENLLPGGDWLYRLLISFVSAATLTFLLILLADNFFYTLFGLGFKSVESPSRWFLLIAILMVFAQFHLKNFRKIEAGRIFSVSKPAWGKLAGVLSLAIALSWGVMITRSMAHSPGELAEVAQTADLPNIIIIGADAVEASHLSLYGYDRDTTPFLDSKKSEFLISDNSFTNNSGTFGAVGSLLTGKLPTTTRLIYPPDKLLGKDQFEHFPGILRNLGYRSLDMTIRWYADAADLNLRNAFEEGNFRKIYRCAGGLGMEFLCRGFPRTILFVERIAKRLTEKIILLNPLDSTYISKDRFVRVGQPRGYGNTDGPRFERAISFIRAVNDQPWFVHIHGMSTHGPNYRVMIPRFSEGKRQEFNFEDDFYDDSILGIDTEIKAVYEYLDNSDQLENTILVITSDHGRVRTTANRLPLLIRFPDTSITGVITANTNRLDIAPTILDYMGLEIPDWMEGVSLLSGPDELQANRPIFSSFQTAVIQKDNNDWAAKYSGPPLYSLGGVRMIVCDQTAKWDFLTHKLTISMVDSHSAPCQNHGALSSPDYQQSIREHLSQRGYDVDSIPEPETIHPEVSGLTK